VLKPSWSLLRFYFDAFYGTLMRFGTLYRLRNMILGEKYK